VVPAGKAADGGIYGIKPVEEVGYIRALEFREFLHESAL
jgi:hypothetical protein